LSKRRSGMTELSCPGTPETVRMWIPTQGGQVFRADGGHPTDLMAATLPI
jgi:hypothetical protein